VTEFHSIAIADSTWWFKWVRRRYKISFQQI